MKILSARKDGEPVNQEQIKEDWHKLQHEHQKACKQDMMWDMFGGIITIDGVDYQVCN